MHCNVAIELQPLGIQDKKDICRLVDVAIADIASSGLEYMVTPFETVISGDFDECMRVLKSCQLAAAKAGGRDFITFAKIHYDPHGDVLSTQEKLAPYQEHNAKVL